MNRLLFIFSIFFLTTAISQPQQQKVNQKDSQGRKHGTWKKAYDDVRQYRYVGQFKNGVPYGKFVYYYKTGAVEAVIQFSDNGKTTRSKMYHESGYLMAQGKYTNQKKDSIWVYYDDRGMISYQESFKDGMLHGQKVYFYAPKDGKLLVSRYEYYKDSLLHGEFKEYYPNTKVKTVGSYRDGNLDGKIIHYYNNGRIKKAGFYKYAVKHGLWSFYNERGELLGTRMFWEGKALEGPEADRKKELWQSQMKK